MVLPGERSVEGAHQAEERERADARRAEQEVARLDFDLAELLAEAAHRVEMEAALRAGEEPAAEPDRRHRQPAHLAERGGGADAEAGVGAMLAPERLERGGDQELGGAARYLGQGQKMLEEVAALRFEAHQRLHADDAAVPRRVEPAVQRARLEEID